jgi:outer membrane protein insertion porin family
MDRHILKGLFIVLVYSVLAWSPAAYAFDLSKPVKDIRIEGNQRADANTIRFYIRSKKGEPYSVKDTREDIKRIYDLGYFDDLKLEVAEDADGLVLVYVVKEKPFVRSVKITGNTEVTEKDLQTIIGLKKGSFYQRHLAVKDIQKIKKKYQKKGFYFTEVTPVTVDVGQNQVDFTYKIDEKQKVRIGKITFKGNRFFKDYKLADQIESKEAGFWSMMSDSGNYQKEILKTDLLRIEALYRDFGFIKALLDEPRVEVDKENASILITMFIHEGEQYSVGDITVEGDSVHSAEEILEKIKLKKGDVFNQSIFRAGLFQITDMYSNDGYAFANPIPDMREHPEGRTVDFNLKVDPGQMVYIGRIGFAGNYKTQDNVLRREFRLLEGERFSGEKLTRSRQRLQNTGFFGTVEMEQKSGKEPDLMDLNVTVSEKETGQLRAGLGYSSVENAMIQAQISENNLFGTGKRLSLGVNASSIRQDYNMDYTEPHFRDRDISLGYSLFNRQFVYQSYITNRLGGGFTFGRGLTEYADASLGYKLERVNLTLNSADSLAYPPSAYVLAQVGERTTSSVSLGLAQDTRDNKFAPTKGYKTDFSTQIAGGPFGADGNFYKLSLGASQYYPLPYSFVFMAHADAKYGATYDGTTLPMFENFFLGGPTSLRGFNYLNVGPRDTGGNAIGGDSSLLFNFEVSYNFTPAVEGVLFYDRGQLYGTQGDLSRTSRDRFDLLNMRHSVGFGIRFTTPAMPIWVAWGFKLDRRDEEPPMEFHFTMGGAF